jgi:hypothetical protein
VTRHEFIILVLLVADIVLVIAVVRFLQRDSQWRAEQRDAIRAEIERELVPVCPDTIKVPTL